MAQSDVCFMAATELAGRIRAKELSAREVMEAHLAQIERVNPRVNAIVTLLPDWYKLCHSQCQPGSQYPREARPMDDMPQEGLPKKPVQQWVQAALFAVPAELSATMDDMPQKLRTSLQSLTPKFGPN